MEGEKKRAADSPEFSKRSKRSRKTVVTLEESSEDELGIPIHEDASSDTEFKPGKTGLDESSSDSEPDLEIMEDEEPLDDAAESDDEKQSKRVSKAPTGGLTSVKPSQSLSILKQFMADDVDEAEGDNVVFPHHKLDFLQPDGIRDGKRRKPDDPDYDPTTLYVPKSYLDAQSPGQQSWWSFKAENFDKVLFFKMGKFYEMFHMDAEVGHKHLNMVYARGERAHVGFPETAFAQKEQILTQLGYTVVRIEQTETPAGLSERKKRGESNTKCVRREVCQISTPGTRLPCALDQSIGEYSVDGWKTQDKETVIPVEFQGKEPWFLSILEESVVNGDKKESHFGVCLFFPTRGQFLLGQFADDFALSRLRTVLSTYSPVEVVYDKKCVSQNVLDIIKSSTSDQITMRSLRSGSEFLTHAEKVIAFICKQGYFKSDESEDFLSAWPKSLRAMVSKQDSSVLSPIDSSKLALRAFGACVYFLNRNRTDYDVMSLKNINLYRPPDKGKTEEEKSVRNTFQKTLILDGVTLQNLDILVNSFTGKSKGSLLHAIGDCRTFFGKRKLKQLMTSPMTKRKSIEEMQKIMRILEKMRLSDPSYNRVTKLMRQLPDLDLLLLRINTAGSAYRASEEHPDSRAQYFGDYSGRKIVDFVSAISGLTTCLKIANIFLQHDEAGNSLWIRQALREDNIACMADAIRSTREMFDLEKVKAEKIIKPNPGADAEYDAAKAELKEINSRAASFLESQKDKYRFTRLKFTGSGRNSFQIEVPVEELKRVPSHYQLKSQTKNVKRFQTKETFVLTEALLKAEQAEVEALQGVARRIYASFSHHFSLFRSLVDGIANLDAFMALEGFSTKFSQKSCYPEFVDPCDDVAPFIEIRKGYHPLQLETFTKCEFVPNDVLIGVEDTGGDLKHNTANMVVITGPNMGGKSTIMRQTALIVLLAHLGCKVPASKCRLTPVDRIFTRIGASDNLSAGESTFFVELKETSTILQHASRNSLVLIDELGRGTATHDGASIAMAVSHELVNLECRTMFSTHYHTLVDDLDGVEKVFLGHMTCMVEDEDVDNPTDANITFLYEFAKGKCPKSYGFNVAKLAGLNRNIILSAYDDAKNLEELNSLTDKFLKMAVFSKNKLTDIEYEKLVNDGVLPSEEYTKMRDEFAKVLKF